MKLRSDEPKLGKISTTFGGMLAKPALIAARRSASSRKPARPDRRHQSQTDDGFKTDHSASVKFWPPLVDTPKSVTVIPQGGQARAPSADGKRCAVPGITFGAGEGGLPLGDRPLFNV